MTIINNINIIININMCIINIILLMANVYY